MAWWRSGAALGTSAWQPYGRDRRDLASRVSRSASGALLASGEYAVPQRPCARSARPEHRGHGHAHSASAHGGGAPRPRGARGRRPRTAAAVPAPPMTQLLAHLSPWLGYYWLIDRQARLVVVAALHWEGVNLIERRPRAPACGRRAGAPPAPSPSPTPGPRAPRAGAEQGRRRPPLPPPPRAQGASARALSRGAARAPTRRAGASLRGRRAGAPPRGHMLR